MPQPYLIGDERAFSDFMTNPSSNPVFAVSGVENQQNGIAAASSAISNTETIIVQRTIEPAATLVIASEFRVHLAGTSTATVANTTTFNVYFGTAGTTSDTKIAHVTTAASGTTGTAVPFVLDLTFTVRTLGTAATGYYTAVLVANAATAIGGGTGPFVFASAHDNTYNTTTGLWISVSCVNAASTTAETFQQAYIEVLP